MLDGSKAIDQPKRDTLVLHVGGWGMRLTTSEISRLLSRKPRLTKGCSAR
jgi:hypothetical protein